MDKSGLYYFVLFALVAFVSSAIFSTAPASARGRSALSTPTPKVLPPQLFDMSPYDDVMQLQVREMPGYLDFTGSTLKPIARVRVACFCQTSTNRGAQSLDFEDYWYQAGNPIGLKQLSTLPIKERDRVAILLPSRLKSFSDAEVAACAATLVRLRLQLSLNRNAIVAVRIPDQYMDMFISDLRQKNFLPYREVRAQLKVLIPLNLESDLGRRETLCFVTANND